VKLAIPAMNILSGYVVRPVLRVLPVAALAALASCASNGGGGGSAGSQGAGGRSHGGTAGTSGGHSGSADQEGLGGAASGSGGALGSSGGAAIGSGGLPGGSAGAAGRGGVSGSSGAAGASGSAGAAGGPPVTGPYKWRGVAFGGGGFVSAVIPSRTEKNLFFARTDVGGLFRWNEADASWVQLAGFVSDSQTGFLGVESVALDPRVPGRVYALVGIDYFNGGKTAILRSTNNGDSFTVTEVTSQFKAHGNGMGRQNGERLAVDPNSSNVLFCGTRRNGLFKSTDSGATWNQVGSFPATTTANDNGISLVLFDQSSSTPGTVTRRIYAGVSRLGQANFYVSTDAGATWNEVAGAPSTSQMPQRAVLAPNGALFVTFADGAGPKRQFRLRADECWVHLEIRVRAIELDEHHPRGRDERVQRHRRERRKSKPARGDQHQQVPAAALGLRRSHLREQRWRQQLDGPHRQQQGDDGL
jgi:hypothetical protein